MICDDSYKELLLGRAMVCMKLVAKVRYVSVLKEELSSFLEKRSSEAFWSLEGEFCLFRSSACIQNPRLFLFNKLECNYKHASTF